MPSHGVGEGYLKEVVVPGQEALENIGQPHALVIGQIRKTKNVTSWQKQYLERPDSPVRHDSQPVLAIEDNPLLLLSLEITVVHE
jgi:hypothetical protein